MLYETPRYRTSGERHLLVELGEAVSLEANFRAIALSRALEASAGLGAGGIKAIVDTQPSFTTVLIEYNPQLLTQEGLKQFCSHHLSQLAQGEQITLNSRLIEIPVAYNDRWCRDCFEDYCKTVKPIEDNLELICRINDLDSVEALIDYHSSIEWWVGTVGFIAGLPVLMPLAADFKLRAPKYDPPRTWTPSGTIALGGGFTAIYPMVTPDGYQMLGRTPLTLFDPQSNQAPFEESPVLISVGDRVKFVPISEARFEEIEQEIAAGTYRYSISMAQPVSLGELQQPLPLAA